MKFCTSIGLKSDHLRWAETEKGRTANRILLTLSQEIWLTMLSLVLTSSSCIPLAGENYGESLTGEIMTCGRI